MELVMIAAVMLAGTAGAGNLLSNGSFEEGSRQTSIPAGFELKGGARWANTGLADELATNGVALDSTRPSGSVSQLAPVNQAAGKWLTFRFRGRADDGFAVGKDALYMRLDFYADGGQRYMESAKRLIYREILRDRKDLKENGNFAQHGAEVWRTYELEELAPFREVDAVRVTVGFENGAGKAKTYSEFLVDDFSLTQSSTSSTGKQDPADRKPAVTAAPDPSRLVTLGGRWYYRLAEGEAPPAGRLVVNAANADRIYYRDDRMGNPFAGNMGAWLRKGYLDAQGQEVKQDRWVPDNVTLTFQRGNVSVTTHNLPNHPTAKFPDTYGTQGYNPGYIQEQVRTYTIPLEPKRNPQALSVTKDNSNYALNMGPVGLAVNGVVFFNPFDANSMDAANLMDRCCGHPNPGANQYHYHKYPICVNTPFVDKGDRHSPLIGFALDGFPVYGPYESDGVLARDLKANPLDRFNAHYDEQRGWHYHVTPGRFPYIIGGYMGQVSWGR